MQTLQLSNKKAWVVFLMASLFPLYGFVEMNLLNTFGPYLIAQNYSLGVLSASYFYADSLMLLPAGLLLDRFNTKFVMLSGLALSCCGSVLFSSSSAPMLLVVARVISGAGHAFALLGCFRLISLCFHAKKQALMIGLVITIALFGGVLAQTPMSFLILKIGPNLTLWCNAFFGVVVLVVLFFALPRRVFCISNARKTNFIQSIVSVVKLPQNWCCGFYAGCIGLPLSLLGATWGVTYFSVEKSLSAVEVSWFMSSLFVGVIVGSPVAGWLSDKYQQRRLPMIFGSVVTIGLMFVVLFTSFLGFIGMLFAMFFLSFFSSTQVLSYPVVTESNLGAHTSTAMGFMNVIVMFLAASYQVVFGAIWSNSALNHLSGLFIIFIMFVGLTVSFCVRESLS